jgi:hypothetical protein
MVLGCVRTPEWHGAPRPKCRAPPAARGGVLLRLIDIKIILRDKVDIPGVMQSSGRPIINEFNGEPFHIALARPSGSFEFTYAEIGLGTTSVTSEMEMAYEDSWAHWCIHHFNQDGLIR